VNLSTDEVKDGREKQVEFNMSTIAGKTIGIAALRVMANSFGVGYYPRQRHIRALSTS